MLRVNRPNKLPNKTSKQNRLSRLYRKLAKKPNKLLKANLTFKN